MISRHLITIALLLAMQLVVANDEEDAIQFADSWFTLVDQKEFRLAWEALTRTSQEAETKRIWIFALGYIHDQIGGIESRVVTEKRFERGADGQVGLAVFTFESKYALQSTTVEILRVGKINGVWKVITYELKDPVDPPHPGVAFRSRL